MVLWMWTWLGACPVTQAESLPDQPVITAIAFEDTNLVITVSIPTGLKKVTLESRTRLGAGTWIPVAVTRIEGKGSTLNFTVPLTERLEVLRVRADAADALPMTFYQGTTQYVAAPSPSGNAMAWDYRDGAGTPTANTETKDREVVESDIWKISGATLYFFNQNRGLQVIDISNPSTPVLRGTYSVSAYGEQMYAVDPYVVLLVRGNCSSSYPIQSEVLILKVVDGIPQKTASLPVTGTIQETRMVGAALYVASYDYRPIPGDVNGSWEQGTVLNSFDLSNPAQPVSRTTLWYAGYQSAVMATDEYFFLAANNPNNWYQSTVYLADITAADGTMVKMGAIPLEGQVYDKFKMSLNNDVFSVIYQKWDDSRRWITELATYTLTNATAPKRLGMVQLAEGEQLHATRFDGDRAYIVTFFRVDPLWVVDLSDPAKPAIKGELQVPGWSTYIQPYGNRLVAIGIDNSNQWKTAVSLFDVADVSNPYLVSKVLLGEEGSYTYSEANYDEKAFAVLPDDGLVLVPYQGYGTNGTASRVQLIDLALDSDSTNALKLRGVIEHPMAPRRATLYEDRILSLSGTELLSVDAQNRDKPVVLSTLDLAWSVDQVVVSGDYLIELTKQTYSSDASALPTIRVAKADQPNTVLSLARMTNGMPIVGATIRGDRLYVAQAPDYYSYSYLVGNAGTNAEPSPTFLLSTFDATVLPQLKLLGSTSVTSSNGSSTTYKAFWLENGTLVWSAGGWAWPWLYADVRLGAGLGMVDSAYYFPWYGRGYAQGQLLAFDASGELPRLVSDITLNATNRWSISEPKTLGNLMYASYQVSEWKDYTTDPALWPRTITSSTDPKTGQITYTTNVVSGQWVYPNYLQVVDYADSSTPVLRKPVEIPGTLQGVSHGGEVLYTSGYRWMDDGQSDYVERLDILAYDGVAAHLVDSLKMPVWPHPILVLGNDVLIGASDATTNQLNNLETWTLSNSGRFIRMGAVSVPAQAYQMNAFGKLLAVNCYNGLLRLYDAATAAQLRLVGQSDTSDCVWYSADNGDGVLGRGVWLPLGYRGVYFLPVKP